MLLDLRNCISKKIFRAFLNIVFQSFDIHLKVYLFNVFAIFLKNTKKLFGYLIRPSVRELFLNINFPYPTISKFQPQQYQICNRHCVHIEVFKYLRPLLNQMPWRLKQRFRHLRLLKLLLLLSSLVDLKHRLLYVDVQPLCTLHQPDYDSF